jgi:hypothetical protein
MPAIPAIGPGAVYGPTTAIRRPTPESSQALEFILDGPSCGVVRMQFTFEAGPSKGLGKATHFAQQVDSAQPRHATIGRNLFIEIEQREVVLDNVLHKLECPGELPGREELLEAREPGRPCHALAHDEGRSRS